MTLEELTREYRGIVERIPNYIIEAAKGRIRVNGIKGSIAKRILLKNGKPADTIMKKWGWRTGTPLGRSEMGITRPNIRDRRSIQKQEKNNTEHDKHKQEEKNRKKWKEDTLHTRLGTQETRKKQCRQI